MIEKTLSLDEMKALYRQVMGGSWGVDFDEKGARFTARQYDGMDGCWTDLHEATNVSIEEALKAWVDGTEGGTRCTKYDHIDYYVIFPADTRMVWDGSPGREMHRS